MRSKLKSIKQILYQFFISENSLEPKLQLLSQIIQGIVYVTIINGINFSQILGVFSQNSVIFAALLILLILKAIWKLTIRFGVSLIAIHLIISNPDAWLIPNCLLLSILATVQFLGSITFDYSSESLHGESRVENKAMRLVILTGNILAFILLNNSKYVNLVSVLLLAVLLWRKQGSLMKSQDYRSVTLRFYFYAACQHLRLFLSAFFACTTVLYMTVSFLISQLMFALLVYLRPKPNYHELLAK